MKGYVGKRKGMPGTNVLPGVWGIIKEMQEYLRKAGCMLKRNGMSGEVRNGRK